MKREKRTALERIDAARAILQAPAIRSESCSILSPVRGFVSRMEALSLTASGITEFSVEFSRQL